MTDHDQAQEQNRSHPRPRAEAKDADTIINAALLNALTSNEALQRIYHVRKAYQTKLSLRLLCRKAGIPSAGYLSDVLRGKRKLHKKYDDALCTALALNSNQCQYLKLLLQEEREGGSEEEGIQRKKQLRKVLSLSSMAIPAEIGDDLLFHIIVLSAFSLFSGRPTITQLRGFFGKSLGIPLEKSLYELKRLGFVRDEGETLVRQNEHILFSDSEVGFSHTEFIAASAQAASNACQKWYSRSEDALFTSTIISTSKTVYQRLLPEIRQRMFQLQSDLDQEPADSLIRFNVQVYPFEVVD